MITSGETIDQRLSRAEHLGTHLAAAVKSLPLGLLILDWDLRVWWFNIEAARVCAVWNHGEQHGAACKENRVLRVPQQLRTAAATLRARWHEGQATPPIVHSEEACGLHAEVALCQPAAGESAFHIQLDYRRPRGDRDQPMSPAALSLLARLSNREREVALHIREGLTTAEIAAVLHRSPLTVKTQVSSILGKLGLSRRTRVAALLNR